MAKTTTNMAKPQLGYIAAIIVALDRTGLSPDAIDGLLVAKWPSLTRQDLAIASRAAGGAQNLAADLLERRPNLEVVK